MAPQPESAAAAPSLATCHYKTLIVLTCIVRLYKCTHE